MLLLLKYRILPCCTTGKYHRVLLVCCSACATSITCGLCMNTKDDDLIRYAAHAFRVLLVGDDMGKGKWWRTCFGAFAKSSDFQMGLEDSKEKHRWRDGSEFF